MNEENINNKDAVIEFKVLPVKIEDTVNCIYLLERSAGSEGGYETYDSAVVIAESEEAAIKWHPNGDHWDNIVDSKLWWWKDSWVTPEHVIATKTGIALAGSVPGVMLASFNGG